MKKDKDFKIGIFKLCMLNLRKSIEELSEKQHEMKLKLKSDGNNSELCTLKDYQRIELKFKYCYYCWIKHSNKYFQNRDIPSYKEYAIMHKYLDYDGFIERMYYYFKSIIPEYLLEYYTIDIFKKEF